MATHRVSRHPGPASVRRGCCNCGPWTTRRKSNKCWPQVRGAPWWGVLATSGWRSPKVCSNGGCTSQSSNGSMRPWAPGIGVGETGGIKVDDHLRTDIPHIWAGREAVIGATRPPIRNLRSACGRGAIRRGRGCACARPSEEIANVERRQRAEHSEDRCGAALDQPHGGPRAWATKPPSAPAPM